MEAKLYVALYLKINKIIFRNFETLKKKVLDVANDIKISM
jgi:hypothetical protein